MAKLKNEDLVELSRDKVAISRRKLGGEAPIVVNEITDGCLYCGLFGTLDSARIKSTMDLILSVTSTTDNNYMIIDLSNVELIDSAIASHLMRINKTLRMVGMNIIFCGIKPIVAQSMVSAGIDIESVEVYKNLKIALKRIYKIQGLALVKLKE